mgnify:CR=1 FL=1
MDELISQFDLFLWEIIEKVRLTAPFSLGVAVSGGADSMALAYLTHQWAKKYGIFIKTVTVDHNLRPESAFEAQQVHQWLEKWEIPHEILLWTPPKDQKITHEEARTGRYHLLIQWCLKNHIPMLLLAHHALDQAETILMRFCKSSHLRGLRGMDKVQKKDGVFLARNETYGYYGVVEKSNDPEIQKYLDSLFILESVNKIFNDLEIKAKNVYNPFINTLNTMYIRENINYYIYVDHLTANRVAVVNGRFGFPKITSNRNHGLYEDGMTLPTR